MKFWLQQTSVFLSKDVVKNHPGSFLESGQPYIEINTIDEILDFVKKYNTEIVIGRADKDSEFYLEHYDTFRE